MADMDIAAAVINQTSTQVASDINISLLKKTLDNEKQLAAALIQTLPPPPSIDGRGRRLNVYA